MASAGVRGQHIATTDRHHGGPADCPGPAPHWGSSVPGMCQTVGDTTAAAYQQMLMWLPHCSPPSSQAAKLGSAPGAAIIDGVEKVSPHLNNREM